MGISGSNPVVFLKLYCEICEIGVQKYLIIIVYKNNNNVSDQICNNRKIETIILIFFKFHFWYTVMIFIKIISFICKLMLVIVIFNFVHLTIKTRNKFK